MKIKTSELTGAALNWAVAKCEKHDIGIISIDEQWQRFISNGVSSELALTALPIFRASLRPKLCVIEPDGYKNIFAASKLNYSTDWSQGGPIIEREKIGFKYTGTAMEFVAWLNGELSTKHDCYGPTPLIAAMRCFVSSRLGDEVDVPDELTGD